MTSASGWALEDVRIADFSWAWAGPYCTTMLADMGAEVINIEGPPRTSNLRLQPPFPDGQPGGVDRGGWFSANQRGKLSCTLNLKKQKGIELARALVAVSDAVVENFSPGVMKRFGLDYRELKKVQPDLVMLSMSGYGASGPHSHYVAYGTHVAMSAGLAGLTGDPAGGPSSIMIPYGDPVAGLTGSFALLTALHHRAETGEGQYIDLSQAESLTCFMAEALTDCSMNGREQTREGNSHRFLAPHGCYPCREEETWITIAVTNDEEWEALCRVAEKPAWISDQRFADAWRRKKHWAELDELIAAWTVGFDHYELMEKFQAMGVSAFPSLNAVDLINDRHLRARAFFMEDNLPEMRKKMIAGPAWRMSDTPGRKGQRAPLWGEHNEYVFGELLGLSSKQIIALEDEEVILPRKYLT